MAAFVAGMLGMSQQEFRFRVQRADQLTVAPLLSLYHSISPLLGLTETSSSDDLPLVAVVDEAVPSFTFSQPAQLLEDADGELTQAQSDASALEPLSLNSDAKFQEGELQLTLCEQGLCGRGEALPRWEEGKGECLSFCSEVALAGQGEALPQVEEEGSQGLGREVADLSLARGVGIAQLDGGCLVKILSQVDNKTLRACSLVCHEWLEVSSFARTLMSLQEGPQIAALPTLVARFTSIKTLHIQGPKTSPEWMLPLEPQTAATSLTEQAVIAPLDDFALEMIAQGCSSVRELDLECCSGFSDAGLAAVLRGCSELIELSLAYCGGVTGEAFNGLTCRLEKLNLDACVGVKNEGLLAIATACPGLRDLGVQTDQQDASLADGLVGIARACGGLQALLIHACGVGDSTLLSVATSCPQLRSVHISCEYSITDGGLASFLAAVPTLETMELRHMKGLSRVPSCRANSRLKRLRLGYWWDTPDLVLREVSEETTLEELQLVCCPYLTDATVAKILDGCKSLQSLFLYIDELLTAETLRAYSKTGRKVKLEIGECSGLDRDKLTDEMRHLRNIIVE